MEPPSFHGISQRSRVPNPAAVLIRITRIRIVSEDTRRPKGSQSPSESMRLSAERGRDLFRVACERDLEGIVAKWGSGTYQAGGGTSWLKIKNPEYSQIAGRRELFEARRDRRQAHRAPAPELRLV